jgi:hypothetical protein
MIHDEGQAGVARSIQKQIMDMYMSKDAPADPAPKGPGLFYRRGDVRYAVEVPEGIAADDVDVYRLGALELVLLASGPYVFAVASRFWTTESKTPWARSSYSWHKDQGCLKANPFGSRDPESLPEDARRLHVFLLKAGTGEVLTDRRLLMDKRLAFTLDRLVGDTASCSLRSEADYDGVARRTLGIAVPSDEPNPNPMAATHRNPDLRARGFAFDPDVWGEHRG